MGGSGASLYKDSEGVERTGAYIASRIVKKKVEDILISNSNLSIDSIINLLKKEISETLETENKKYQNKEKSALKAPDERTLYVLKAQAELLGVPCSLIIDAGMTEIPAGSVTALGIGPAKRDIMDKITADLKLL